MRRRPILILLLFVIATGAMVWVYATITRPPTAATEPQWVVTLTDLDACSRRKHIKAAQYSLFSTIATEERHNAAARLFRALALAERVQEHNCAGAIVRLGGNYTPPRRLLIFRSTTANNLERSIIYERQLSDSTIRDEIDRAITSGNRYAARMLVWARAGDLQHAAFIERTQRDGALATATYLVCPTCGNIYSTDSAAPYCPNCLTDGRRFVLFE